MVMQTQEITVLTTSYNKKQYLLSLKDALDHQSLPQGMFEWWVMDNSTDDTRDEVLSWDEDWIKVTTHDFTEQQRRERFVHPVLMNQAVDELPLDENKLQFFVHISDDDLPHHKFVESLASFLRFNRDKMAAYVPMRQTQLIDGVFVDRNVQIPSATLIFGGKLDPVTHLDGNGVMLRLDGLKALGKPWDEDWETAGWCDGYMLRRFGNEIGKIWPAAQDVLMDHRVTELSTFLNSRLGNNADAAGDPLCERIFGRVD